MTTLPYGIMHPKTSAVIAHGGLYRYELSRRWGDNRTVNFVMLNPSTADQTHDDATIRRCIGFAQSWGYGRLAVTNLFALRATDPRELTRVDDPTGLHNDAWLRIVAQESECIVAAWGARGSLLGRDAHVLDLLPAPKLHYLRLTKGGHPSHPLYLPRDLRPTPWKRDGGSAR